MRADAFLAAAEALPIRDLSELVGWGGLLIVAPHPDDESLGCGGLIAEACMRDLDVRLIVVSDGVGSHRGSNLYPPTRLKALRETETIKAVAFLGLERDHVQFFGLPDAGVPSKGALAEDAIERIRAAAEACDAGAICVTWGYDPHCDHEAAAMLVRAVGAMMSHLKIFAYPIWGWTLSPDKEVGSRPTGLRLDVTRHLAAKRKAIFAHASQTSALINDDPKGFRLDAAMIERFITPYEIFIELQGSA